LADLRLSDVGVAVWVLVIVGLSFFFIQLLTIPGEHVIAQLGPVPITWEAVDRAGAVALRIMVFVPMSMTFVQTTEPRDFGLMLIQQLHVNYVFALMMFMFLRIFPLLEQEILELRAAHQLRGIEERRGLGGYAQSLREYLIPMLTRGLRRGEITAYAMDSKAFRAFPERTYLRSVEFTRTGKVFSLITVTISAAAIILGIWLGSLTLWLETK
jgi:energy-coupling factor transport system permease protein